MKTGVNFMLWGDNRNEYRLIFFTAWEKFKNHEILTDLEQQLVSIIQQHPEYVHYLENREKYEDYNFLPELDETNPFLHFSLHLTLLEQLSIDKPNGIRTLYKELLDKLHLDPHELEHHIMNELVQELYSAYNQGREFSSETYMKNLKNLLK